jgi:predicted dehydrogenase
MVEKPLAASYAEAREVVLRADEYGLVLLPGHTFLYSPSVNLVKERIDAEDLGEIYFISTSRVNLGLHQADVSVAWDLAPHDFSILRYWLQDTPLHVSALSRDCILPGTPDVAFINLEFPCQTIAHVELSWLAPAKLRRTTIVGSRKMIVYDDTSTEPVRIFDSGVLQNDPQNFGEFNLTYRTGDVISPRVAVAEPLALEIADFCECIWTGNRPRSDATLGLDVVRMIEATDRSIRSNGARVPTSDSDGTFALDAAA